MQATLVWTNARTQKVLKANEQTVQWHVAKRRKSIEKLADGWQKGCATFFL